MITVSQKVDELVNQSPYIREAMADKLINLSSLARKIKPQIEKDLKKTVTEGSVLIALQRYAGELKPYYQSNPGHYLANLTLRSDLFELTVKNSPDLLSQLSEVSKHNESNYPTLFIFTQGIFETTIITGKALQTQLDEALKDEEVLQSVPDLTAISLQRTKGQIERTGVLQFPLRILAWEGISVIEIITTLNEIMLVVRDFEVDRAVSSIRQALKTVSEQ